MGLYDNRKRLWKGRACRTGHLQGPNLRIPSPSPFYIRTGKLPLGVLRLLSNTLTALTGLSSRSISSYGVGLNGRVT